MNITVYDKTTICLLRDIWNEYKWSHAFSDRQLLLPQTQILSNGFLASKPKPTYLTVCEISGGPVANGSLKPSRATGFQNPVAKMATANF